VRQHVCTFVQVSVSHVGQEEHTHEEHDATVARLPTLKRGGTGHLALLLLYKRQQAVVGDVGIVETYQDDRGTLRRLEHQPGFTCSND
jgi:hypothetical protein